MKIRTLLTLKYTCATAAVFLLCLLMVYVISDHARSRTFFHDLKNGAMTKAHLFLENRLDRQAMQSVYRNDGEPVDEVEVAVYTSGFDLLYQDVARSGVSGKAREMVADILTHRKEKEFYIDGYQGVGMVYTFEGGTYVVTAVAYDSYGYDNLSELRMTLFVLFFVGLSMLFVTGYFLAGSSLRPMSNIVTEAEAITASNIDRRLPVQEGGRDELYELSSAFNALLDRLEASFNSQKMFISNVSHELRTPLATLIAELDFCRQKPRTESRYLRTIENSLLYAWQMTDLIEGLLDLAKADYQKERIKMQPIRLDELLLDARKFLLRAHPEYCIELLFEQEEADDDRLITVMGNLYLLNIAFSNLMENNCKYSGNHSSFIQISFWDKWTIVRLSDNGVGMTQTDKQILFKLFYRGGHESVEGHGIGMALVQKIILLHEGSIAVHSEEGEGTTFIIKLLHV